MFLRSQFFSPEGEDGASGSGAGSHQSTSSATSSNRVDDDNDKGSSVPREAYERLQKDLVKFKSRARDFESKNNQYESDAKARAEAKLLEEKEFQKVIEQKEQEIKELRGTVDNYHVRDEEAAKYSAFTNAVGKRIPDKFLPVIPLDEISITDGEIDPAQVKDVAGKFMSTYPEIFRTSSGAMPGDFPAGKGSKKLSKAEYIAQGRVKGAKWMQQQVKSGNVDFG